MTCVPDDDGFVMVEAIVALAIAVLSLAVLWQAISGAYRGAARIKDTEQTLMIARSQLDEIAADGTVVLGTTRGTYANGAVWQITTSPVRPANNQTTAERRAIQPYWIVLEVRTASQALLFKLQTARLAGLRE
jgi:type II secretory pathway pseudopilin PulG